MASDLGQKLLPEGGDALASFGAEDRSIQANEVIVVALGSNNSGREEASVSFPEGDVASGEVRVYTIEDDDVMGVDGVAITETLILLLASNICNIENNEAVVSLELNGEDFGANGGLVDRLEGVLDMALEESALANATIAHKDNLIRGGSHFS